MKKLTLNLEEIRVESFDTSPESQDGRGTVHGRGNLSVTCFTDCGEGCSGDWCAGQSTTPCQGGTYDGRTCDTTCYQIACGCSGAWTQCDLSCNGTCADKDDTCAEGCVTYLDCPTVSPYPGC